MIKRANKVTALLVAAASIMSVVPAMAATKLGTKDGTIEKAVAYKNGSYLYQGYRTDDDDTGLYYNSGDKDKRLDSADAFGTGKYDDKYVTALDGSDEYLVDLTKGTISDDDTETDFTTTAQTKLETKLNKTDRYGNKLSTGVRDYIFNRIDKSENRFGDVWYAYSATTQSGVTVSTVTTTSGAVSYSGYTNGSGSYIDCSKDANIYVYNGTKMVKLECLGDIDTTGANKVTLDSIEYKKTLGQDDKYIYRLILAHVSGAKYVDNVAALKAFRTKYNISDSILDSAIQPAVDTEAQTIYYVQKISKAQGDTEKDAYLPKTTESYALGKSFGDGDVSDAYDCLIGNSEASDPDALTYIVDGSIYTTFRENGEKVKTTRVDLKTSTKLEVDGTSAKKVDGHVAVKNGDKDTKIKDKSTYGDAWTVDVAGNVWAIYDGEILESTKVGDFKTVYNTDRSFDRLDVYDKDNLIAWEDDGNAYTTVNEGKKQAADDAGALVTPAKVGWEQLSDGTWTFYDATGTKVVNNWANIGGVWYFLDVNGAMATGWQQVNGSWYYLNPISDGTKGAMKTGWLNDNGTWYFLNSSGAMETGWKNINGSWYYLNPISDGTRGAMKSGWINDNGTWYYLYSNGSMASNTIINGYKLSSNGALI